MVEKVERLKNVLSYIAKAGILDCKPRLVEAHLNAVNLVVCKNIGVGCLCKAILPTSNRLVQGKDYNAAGYVGLIETDTTGGTFSTCIERVTPGKQSTRFVEKRDFSNGRESLASSIISLHLSKQNRYLVVLFATFLKMTVLSSTKVSLTQSLPIRAIVRALGRSSYM